MPYVVFPSYFGSAAEIAEDSFAPPSARASLTRSRFCTNCRQLKSDGVSELPAAEEAPPPTAPPLPGPGCSPTRAPLVGGGMPEGSVAPDRLAGGRAAGVELAPAATVARPPRASGLDCRVEAPAWERRFRMVARSQMLSRRRELGPSNPFS